MNGNENERQNVNITANATSLNQLIGIQNNMDLAEKKFSAYIRAVRDTLGQSYARKNDGHPFYYRSNVVDFVGRERELARLEEFCRSEGAFKWSALNGPGGSGKSRLAYEFIRRTRADKAWTAVMLDWSLFRRDGAFAHTACAFDTDLLLILDYILADAKEIGQWMRGIRQLEGARRHKLRILLIERELYKEDAKPLWYDWIVKGNNLEDCQYKPFIALSPLGEDDLAAAAQSYIAFYRNKTDAAAPAPDIDTIREQIVAPLAKIDGEHQRPIFALYIADAWIRDPARDVRKWRMDELLSWINANEEKRIERIFEPDGECAARMKNLLAYATATGELTKQNLPDFLADDWRHIQNFRGASIKSVFNAVNLENRKNISLGAIVPDLMGEYFCLEFLKQEKWANGEEEFIESFVRSAWRNSPEAFLSFLDRVANDFLDHELASFDWLFQEPDQCVTDKDIGSCVGYCKFLFSLTYRNNVAIAAAAVKKLDEYRQVVKLMQITLLYARGLVNLTASFDSAEKRNEVADRLSALQQLFPDNSDIALAYAHGLFNLIITFDSAEKRNEVADRLSALHQLFPNNSDIALSYAKGLVNLTVSFDSAEKRNEVADRLSALHQLFPDNSDIALAYAKGLVNLTASFDSAEKRNEVADRLSALHQLFPNNSDIALSYAQGLVNLTASFDSSEKRNEVVDRLSALHQLFPDNSDIALSYAQGLVNLTASFDSSEKRNEVVDRLFPLHQLFPNNSDIATEYAKGLFNLNISYDSADKTNEIVNKLCKLYNLFFEDKKITSLYAIGLLYLCVAHQDSMARDKVIDTIKNIYLAHPDLIVITSIYILTLKLLEESYQDNNVKHQIRREINQLCEKYDINEEEELTAIIQNFIDA